MAVEECKPTKEGIEERETILNYLEMEFRKTYPNSRLCAYGSFYNGFGLQHSDLDICVLLELNVCIRFWSFLSII
ncbi:unnamed protein product [Rotaria sordida]|uniref:Poly(A) RNA polymerase mitochondrial-like central palm domain-containing protein n=1 Tax=Rotaria sordida TaxID=392033 RepID=A0A818WVV8_9BILA|nr:unnamed protein product [Rotaria sordida]